MTRREPPEIVYVERGNDSSARWLFWGALLGAGLALLYAPRSGEETRRVLQRRLRQLRAMTEEKLDELVERFGPGGARPRDAGSTGEYPVDGEFDDDPLPAAQAEPVGGPVRPPAGGSARQELKRRLAEARARRRRPAPPEAPGEGPS